MDAVQYTDLNGKTYFALSERPYYNVGYTFATFVRKDWLDKVGLGVPQNYTEYCAAIDAIMAAGLTDQAPIGYSLPATAYVPNFGFRDIPVNESEWAMHSSLGTASLSWEPTKNYLKRQNAEFNKGYLSKEFELDVAAAGAGTGSVGVGAAPDAGGMTFDLSGVEENKTFEVIPKGTYDAVVDELDFGDSNSGNPMVTVKYAITSPEYEKRVIWDYWVLAGKGADYGLAKLKKFLVRVMPEVDVTSFNPKDFADQGLAVGRLCQLVLGIQVQKQGEYKGEKRNTVKDVLAPNNGGFLG
jgi:hypothetical protein